MVAFRAAKSTENTLLLDRHQTPQHLWCVACRKSALSPELAAADLNRPPDCDANSPSPHSAVALLSGMAAPTPAPWDSAAPKDQFFVLVTGANSGIGLGIAERLVDWFLTPRSPASHLILITTTRSRQKSLQTTEALRDYVRKAVASNPTLRGRAGPSCDPASVLTRIHLLSIQLDLCKLPTVHAATELLMRGPDGPPTEEDLRAGRIPAPIPRLDSIIFNAGIGGWSGLSWLSIPGAILKDGLIHQLTWPSFKISYVGNLVDPITGRALTSQQAAAEGLTRGELLGETFTANIFGHYVFAHTLLPLLDRTREQLGAGGLARGRVVWVGSVTPEPQDFSISDFQGVASHDSYESTKRLADLLFLTAELPRVKPIAARYLTADEATAVAAAARNKGGKVADGNGGASPDVVPPRIYITHPGIVQTTIYHVPSLLVFWYGFALYIARWIGSPWHPVKPYGGAVAPVWCATEGQEHLDSLGAERVKWGSSVSFWGKAAAKRTEVEGWGWDGRTAAEMAADQQYQRQQRNEKRHWLRDRFGRKSTAVDLKPEALQDFEVLGAQCWEEMERLRLKWDEALGNGKPQTNGRALAA
ncbi:hypothetical protein RB593_003220 [Gaeumannomyces tritici]